jgi:hypothetical protein
MADIFWGIIKITEKKRKGKKKQKSRNSTCEACVYPDQQTTLSIAGTVYRERNRQSIKKKTIIYGT